MKEKNLVFDFATINEIKAAVLELNKKFDDFIKTQNQIDSKWKPESNFYDMISKSKFYELRKQGKIKFIKPNGKTTWINVESLNNYLNELANQNQ